MQVTVWAEAKVIMTDCSPASRLSKPASVFLFGLWAAVRKSDGAVIGQCGLSWQSWGDRRVLEVGYLFRRSAWHQGYATEAARACRDYAFDTLGFDEVCSIIRDNNLPSQAVACLLYTSAERRI